MTDREALIAERLAKATPGPWALDEGDGDTIMVRAGTAISNRGRYSTTDMIHERDVDYLYERDGVPGAEVDQVVADAELIANAPADLAWLLAEREELGEAYRRLNTQTAKVLRERQAARAEVDSLRAELAKARDLDAEREQDKWLDAEVELGKARRKAESLRAELAKAQREIADAYQLEFAAAVLRLRAIERATKTEGASS